MPNNLKLVDYNGLKIVAAFLTEVASTADDASSAVLQNQKDLQSLSEGIVAALTEIEEALTTIEETKSDKPTSLQFAIELSGWSASGIEKYPYMATLTSDAIAGNELVRVNFAPACLGIALAAGLSVSCKVEKGKITVYAMHLPAGGMSGQVWLDPSSTVTDNGYGFVNLPSVMDEEIDESVQRLYVQAEDDEGNLLGYQGLNGTIDSNDDAP